MPLLTLLWACSGSAFHHSGATPDSDTTPDSDATADSDATTDPYDLDGVHAEDIWYSYQPGADYRVTQIFDKHGNFVGTETTILHDAFHLGVMTDQGDCEIAADWYDHHRYCGNPEECAQQSPIAWLAEVTWYVAPDQQFGDVVGEWPVSSGILPGWSPPGGGTLDGTVEVESGSFGDDLVIHLSAVVDGSTIQDVDWEITARRCSAMDDVGFNWP
jgi:hypothetical protein